MRYVLIALLLTTAPVRAEEAGRDLIERGAELLLEGLMREMGPTIDELSGLGDRIGPALKGFVTEMGPALESLLSQVEDWSAYHPPEILENGDIIFRRKLDLPDGEGIDI